MSERKAPELPDPEERPEVEEFSAEELPFTPSYIHKMEAFLKRTEIGENEPTYYLYRFVNERGSKKRLVDRFESSSPPDEHDIGLEHGSGKYLLLLTIPANKQFPKGTSRGYQFYVDEIYDQRKTEYRDRRQAQVSPPPVQQQIVPAVNPASNFIDTLSIIEKIAAMVTPLLLARSEQKQPDFTGIVRDGYKAISEVMQQSMMENFKMLQEVQKKQLKLIEPPKNDEPEPPGILQQFLPLLTEWLPKLMGDDIQSKMTGSFLKSMPQIKEIVNDTKQLNDIVDYLVRTQGINATRQILVNLGIPFDEDENVAEMQHEETNTKSVNTQNEVKTAING